MAETAATAGGALPVRRYSVLQPAVVLGLLGECAIAVAATFEIIGLPLMLAAHLTMVALVALLQLRRLGSCDDGGLALLGVVGMLAAGPFGAACALAMPMLTRRDPESEALLPDWYKRIALSSEQSEFTRLSDRIAIGRAANLAAALPLPFVELFNSGPIGEQQAALGLIAREFHPGYLPVLKMALDSPEPVIRVQAAAVATRIRGALAADVATLLARASGLKIGAYEAIDIAADLKAAADSGLLETKELAAATSVRSELLDRTFSRLDARRRDRALSPDELSGDEADDAYAAHLVAECRLEDFRAFRRSLRRDLYGRYRRRVVISRPILPAMKGKLARMVSRR